MLNNVYTARGTHIIHSDRKIVLEFKGDIVAKDEKEATYKVHCILRGYVSDLGVLSSIKVYLTPVSTLKQVIRNIIPDELNVNTY